jgi:hypothetical protein
MRRDPVGLVWIAGLVLAVLLSVFGPGLLGMVFGIDLVDALDRAASRLEEAAYRVFIALCVLARRRRLPAMGIAIAVTLLFVFLAGAPGAWADSLHGAHWLLSLLLNLGAAALMTRRLQR